MRIFCGHRLTQADDGYSGTTFNRPGVKMLLEAVCNGEICCVIVKDLSRFGRNYLETGMYLEQLFPSLGIRFIAVNDNYDSNNHKGATADIDIAVRNMINAMYSRDVSKKVKTAKQAQARQGKFAGAFAPYGYKKDPNNTHRIIIDEPAAAVVRRIFTLAFDLQGPSRIASILNTESVLTPSAYKRMSGFNLAVSGITESLWSSGSVIRILRDERYAGVFVGARSEAGKLGTGKRKYAPKEDWVKIPDTHPAIISREIWDTVSINKSKHIGRYCKPNTSRVLYKRVRCGHCGHIMRFRAEGKNKYYHCDTPRCTGKYGCLNEKYCEQKLVSVIKAIAFSQMTVMLDMEKLCHIGKRNAEQNAEPVDAATLRFAREIRLLQSLKRQLYERYKSGVLEKTAYCLKREAADADITAKLERRDALLAQIDKNAQSIIPAKQSFYSFLEYPATAEPSDEMVNAMVYAVHVFSRNRIEIRFTFRDELEQVQPFIDR